MVEYNKFEAYVAEMNKRGGAAGVPDCFQSDLPGAGGDIGKW
jgi:hypothetical protein